MLFRSDDRAKRTREDWPPITRKQVAPDGRNSTTALLLLDQTGGSARDQPCRLAGILSYRKSLSSMFETVLLTGAAGVGKTTLAASLALDPRIAVFEYGAELTKRAAIERPWLTQEDIRGQSAAFVTGQHVADTDAALQHFVATHGGTRHLVIDSHAVTKEAYGFRAHPFTPEQLRSAGLSRIVVLHCEPHVLVARIERDPGGRPMLSEWEAAEHIGLQAGVALSYSVTFGIPVHFIDCAKDPAWVSAAFLALLGSAPH